MLSVRTSLDNNLLNVNNKNLQNESAKLRGLCELMGPVGRASAWVRGWVGGVGQSLVWVAWVAWVHKILVGRNFGVGSVGQKNEVRQKNGMGLNLLLFNHTL